MLHQYRGFLCESRSMRAARKLARENSAAYKYQCMAPVVRLYEVPPLKLCLLGKGHTRTSTPRSAIMTLSTNRAIGVRSASDHSRLDLHQSKDDSIGRLPLRSIPVRRWSLPEFFSYQLPPYVHLLSHRNLCELNLITYPLGCMNEYGISVGVYTHTDQLPIIRKRMVHASKF